MYLSQVRRLVPASYVQAVVLRHDAQHARVPPERLFLFPRNGFARHASVCNSETTEQCFGSGSGHATAGVDQREGVRVYKDQDLYKLLSEPELTVAGGQLQAIISPGLRHRQTG